LGSSGGAHARARGERAGRAARAGAARADTGARVLAGAAWALAAVARRGRSAEAALEAAVPFGASAPRPAVQAVTLGALRWYPRLSWLASQLLEGRKVASAVMGLLVAALFQLEYSRHAPEVSVSRAVDAARLLGQPRAAGLVNALLRRFLRGRPEWHERLAADPVAASAHPAWLLQSLQEAWPADWPGIIAADNSAPPLTLRVSGSRCGLQDYRARLSAQGMTAVPLPGFPAALLLERPVPVEQLPGFAEGLVSVQDAGAQLAAPLLGVRPGERVLDACAAPGGKTGALLEAAEAAGGDIELTALDVDARRLARVGETLARLRRSARLVEADLGHDPQWWDGRRFDRILLDAPCSAVGVIRRHPDIKVLRRAADIEPLASAQRRLLCRCLGLLAPGGRLLYSTCSVLPEENDRVVEAALRVAPEARVLPPASLLPGLPSVARACVHGVQLLPGNAALTDGFYYACLTVA